MSHHTKTLLTITGLVILGFLLIKACKKPEKVYITVPATTGKFEKQKPIYIVDKETVYVTKWKTKDNIVSVETENPVNQDLVDKYQSATDSIERFKILLDAIQVRDFTLHFIDSVLDITIDGTTQGEIDYVEPRYTIKEKTFPIPVPPVSKPTFILLGGAEVRSSIKQFDYNVNLGLQNPKGHIYRLGYSKQPNGNFIMVGYDYPLLQFKNNFRKQ